MKKRADFLVEIGTEELPPKSLRTLMQSFSDNLVAAIDDVRLERGDVTAYASPRRLAVAIDALAYNQPERRVEEKGPPVSVAFDDGGTATPAAIAFAKKCGVDVDALQREKTTRGEWLTFERTDAGKSAAELLPDLIENALSALPIPRRMRWGIGDTEFIRPLHWIVLLHGNESIAANVMGLPTSNVTMGHRFLSKGAIKIKSPGTYLSTLEQSGFVIADFERRREMVRTGVVAAAKGVGGQIVDGEMLYDEVAALVEWPVPIVGSFDEQYLSLPRDVVISTLTGHQRYFPVANHDGELLARFVTVANLDSTDPEQVRDGNERVIRPRLADAAFFWANDKKLPLSGRRETLREVVYQRGLGSLFDKSERVAGLAAWLADARGIDSATVVQAARLAKCDLLTDMVGEFPDLQGTMGGFYAAADGEPEAVTTAISDQYRPRFAGDKLPSTADGQLLAVADKLDTLAGVFSVGKKPTGNRDPFSLRRAALGVVRILVECGIDISLTEAIRFAVDAQPKNDNDAQSVADDVYVFVTDRLRRYFLDRDENLATETFDAVMNRKPDSLLDFDRRLAAVQTFLHLEQAASLAAANKRIANILRKADAPTDAAVAEKLLSEDAERLLYSALDSARQKVAPLMANKAYADVLNALADLRDPVDRFFDDVMVMADDEKVKNNRLALLSQLRALFLDVADISRLSIA